MWDVTDQSAKEILILYDSFFSIVCWVKDINIFSFYFVQTETLPIASNLRIVEEKHGKLVLIWDTWITDQPIFYSIRCEDCTVNSVTFLPSDVVNTSR